MAFSNYTAGSILPLFEAEKFPAVGETTSENDLPSRTQDELLVLEPKIKTARPPFFKVLMLNDDFTPMEFVVELLKTVFRHPHEEAVSIMLQIHHKGAGICGVFTRDVAETKAEIAVALARKNEYPLQCVLEKE